jgi:hypothetical protein
VSYSERNSPPHEPAGAAIPSGVRTALLTWLADRNLSDPPKPKELWRMLSQRIGYGGPADAVQDVQARFGREAAETLADAFHTEFQRRRSVPKTDFDRYALPGLTSVPAPLFLDALEIAVQLLRRRGRTYSDGVTDYVEYDDQAAIAEINRLFTLRGIQYRFREDGTAEWHGDEGAFQEVVVPALAALGDARFAGAAQEFGDALGALRDGTRQGQKNAVRDASNAVETAMKTVLDAHSVPRTGKETADPLWDLLHGAGLVAAKTKDTVCAAPRLRNTYGGHGPNPNPDPVPTGIPELSVHAAAAAITYLGAALPGTTP